MADQAREFTAPQRKAAAKTGKALPGGGFPIKTIADLENAIKAFGRAKNKAAAKAHIIARARALKATHRLPKEWKVARGSSSKSKGDKAEHTHELWTCPEEQCERAFLDEHLLQDHAEAVHTFGDIERLVQEAVSDKYRVRGDYKAVPPIPSVWSWVNDLATDWVVFTVEAEDMTLYKASYSITDSVVTLGDAVEVVRKTVYEPVKKETA